MGEKNIDTSKLSFFLYFTCLHNLTNFRNRKRTQKSESPKNAFNKTRKLSESETSKSTITSPESDNQSIALSPNKQNRRTSEVVQSKFKDIFGKENKGKSSIKNAVQWLSANKRVPYLKDKRQMKLSFKKSASNKSIHSSAASTSDENMTSYEEEVKKENIENIEKIETNKSSKCLRNLKLPPRGLPAANTSNETANLEHEFLKLSKYLNYKDKETSPQISNEAEEQLQVISSPHVAEIPIKQEKMSLIQMESPSQDLFSSPDNSSDVICVEQEEKSIFTVPDRSFNPARDMMKDMEIKFRKTNLNHLFEDTIVEKDEESSKPITQEKRKVYSCECPCCRTVKINHKFVPKNYYFKNLIYLQYYDEVAEKKGISQANSDLFNCPISCKGYLARHKELMKFDAPKQNMYRVIRLGGRNRNVQNSSDEENPNQTPDGFWNLEISPRKSKPLRLKRVNNNDA